MCNPVAIALIATTASSAYSVVQGQANAKAQTKYQSRLHLANAANAEENAKTGYAALARRRDQEFAAASQQLAENSAKAKAVRARATVGAAEAGVRGASVDLQIDSYTREELRYQQAVVRQTEFIDAQLASEGEGIRSGSFRQALSTTPSPVAKPSYWQVLIDTASAATATGANNVQNGYNFWGTKKVQ